MIYIAENFMGAIIDQALIRGEQFLEDKENGVFQTSFDPNSTLK